MTAIQLNAEILRNMSIIAEDEKKEDSTLFTKEEFFARIDKAKKQSGKQFSSVEELDQYIRNL